MTEQDPFDEGERYDDMWQFLVESTQGHEAEPWLQKIKGQTVVDLGSGSHTQRFQDFLKKYDVAGYVPIDIKNQPSKDMLQATLELTTDSAYSFSLNGINERIIGEDSDYGKKLTEQLVRLLHPHGLVFGFSGGGILHGLSQKPEMEALFLPVEDVLSDPQNGYYFISHAKQ